MVKTELSNKPLVSIGLPTYNRAPTLVRAIESALTQDYQNIELLISDNASTDETESICLEVARCDNRVKYLRQQANQGATANFREVLERSGGEFFMWLSDDDWLDQSYVGRCVKILLERPDYALVCGKARYFKEGKFDSEGVGVNLLQPRDGDRVLAYYAVVLDNGTLYGLMRRAQARGVTLRNTMGGDWLYVASLAFIGKIETLVDTCVNRDLGGSTVNYYTVAQALGLSHFAATHPRFSIAANAFKDILTSPVYSRCGVFGRLLLASKAFMLLERRQGFYYKRTPREIAISTLIRILPARMLDIIRSQRRQRRSQAGE